MSKCLYRSLNTCALSTTTASTHPSSSSHSWLTPSSSRLRCRRRRNSWEKTTLITPLPRFSRLTGSKAVKSRRNPTKSHKDLTTKNWARPTQEGIQAALRMQFKRTWTSWRSQMSERTMKIWLMRSLDTRHLISLTLKDWESNRCPRF